MDMKNEATVGPTYPEHKNRGGGACVESGQPVHVGNLMVMYGQRVGECCVCFKTLRLAQ